MVDLIWISTQNLVQNPTNYICIIYRTINDPPMQYAAGVTVMYSRRAS